MVLRSLATLIFLAMLSSCRSTPAPGTPRSAGPATLGPAHRYPVAAPRKNTRRLVTPVARIPMN